MIPEFLIDKFKIKKTYAVSKREYMIAQGRPCQIIDLKFDSTLKIICVDIINNGLVLIELTNTVALYTFQPVRQAHNILFVESGHVLTDTEDEEFAVGNFDFAIGDCINTIAGPACQGVWGEYRKIDYISSIDYVE